MIDIDPLSRLLNPEAAILANEFDRRQEEISRLIRESKNLADALFLTMTDQGMSRERAYEIIENVKQRKGES